MTPAPQAKRLSEERLTKMQVSFKDRLHISGYEVRPLFEHIYALEAAAAAREEQVRELVAQVKIVLLRWQRNGRDTIKGHEVSGTHLACLEDALAALNPTGDIDGR